MERGWPRTATLVAAGGQALTVLGVVGIGVSGGLQLDPWRPVALTVLYLVPAVLAVVGLRARPALLLAAATSSVALAVVGFSLHSFVFLPVALVYAVAHLRGAHRSGRLVPVLLAPLLLLAALAVLFVHEDPACYTRYASGEVAVDRNPGDVTTGSQSVAAGSDVVEGGCTSDTVVWWEAAGSVALSVLAVVTLPLGVERTPTCYLG